MVYLLQSFDYRTSHAGTGGQKLYNTEHMWFGKASTTWLICVILLPMGHDTHSYMYFVIKHRLLYCISLAAQPFFSLLNFQYVFHPPLNYRYGMIGRCCLTCLTPPKYQMVTVKRWIRLDNPASHCHNHLSVLNDTFLKMWTHVSLTT